MNDLRQAAQALLNQWDSPLWKNGSTADAIADLRTALEQQQAEPIGWLDGNDKLAEFMHRDLKAEHDKRGSATPREFTVPVYTAPPQQQAEPVAWTTMPEATDWCFVSGGKNPTGKLEGKWFPLYTLPQKRQWVGLDAEDLAQIESDEFWQVGNHMAIAMAVEAKLKERNND